VLLEEVQQHIKQAGLEAIADLKGENIHIDFVENMLAVHKKYRDLIQVKKDRKNSFISRTRLGKISWIRCAIRPTGRQWRGSLIFWCGSGTADPYL
jgi:cullin 2